MGAAYEHLKQLMMDVAGRLSGVTPRRMFGCDAVFRESQIFGLVWKEDRLGVRLPAKKDFDEAMALEGAEPWIPSGMTKGMAHWVLLPEEMHDDEDALARWVKRAHALAGDPTKPAKRSAKKVKL